MSWMDSWSRPTKHAVTPPPLYLTMGDDVPYCRSCGRVIGSRKSQAGQEVKYCSSRCRSHKPGPVDRKIEAAFVSLLDGKTIQNIDGVIQEVENDNANPISNSKQSKGKKKVKGDPRIIVECADVENIVFPREADPDKVFGRKKNRATRVIGGKEEEWKSVDMVSDTEEAEPSAPPVADDSGVGTASDASGTDDENAQKAIVVESAKEYGAGKIRPPQTKSDVNASVGGEKGWAERSEETEEAKAKRIDGQRRAEQREMVRRAARRGCAFGFVGSESEEPTRDGKGAKAARQEGIEQRRKCEAVMSGSVVEASYAKGEWGIRWREKV